MPKENQQANVENLAGRGPAQQAEQRSLTGLAIALDLGKKIIEELVGKEIGAAKEDSNNLLAAAITNELGDGE